MESWNEGHQDMKPTLLAALVVMVGSPAMACTTPSSGYLQVNGQVHCIHQMSEAEIRANQVAAAKEKATKAANKKNNDRIISRRRLDQADRDLDFVGDHILLPGGRERYRKALRAITSMHAIHLRNFGY